jgi:hypothetical protein
MAGEGILSKGKDLLDWLVHDVIGAKLDEWSANLREGQSEHLVRGEARLGSDYNPNHTLERAEPSMASATPRTIEKEIIVERPSIDIGVAVAAFSPALAATINAIRDNGNLSFSVADLGSNTSALANNEHLAVAATQGFVLGNGQALGRSA